MNKHNVLEDYRDAILEKLDNYVKKIAKTDPVKSAEITESGIHIEFVEEVDIDGQDVFNVFMRGGNIKKSASKDNKDEQYFEIPAIGAL